MENNYGFNREEFNKVILLNPINVFFPSDDYYSNEQIDTNRVGVELHLIHNQSGSEFFDTMQQYIPNNQ